MNNTDELSRKRISSEIDTNFFVEAGAGSGKTTQLVSRMTAMIKAGIDVKKICAITFTKAAAQEFYKRFQESLAIGAKDSENDTERQRCSEALQNIDLCFMGTIDAFSQLILHEHPIEARIPSSSAVIDDSHITSVYQREYTNIIHGAYGKELFDKYSLFENVQDSPMKIFMNFFKEIIDSRSNEIIYDRPPAGSIDEIFANEKKDLLQVLKCLVEHKEMWSPLKTCQPANEAIESGYPIIKGSWDNRLGNVVSILNKLKKFRLNCEPAEIGILSESLFIPNQAKGKVYYEFDIENIDLLRELKEYQYSVTIDFLVSAANAISEKLRANGELTYYDYKLYLRDMLRRDVQSGCKLIRHIYDRHSYYLIDEFQDTDPMQAEIFFYITAEEPVEDWRKCIPKAGSLFIVGDPKQSIYRFRSADVAAFKEVRRLFENGAGEVVELTNNFRSTKLLKQSFNRMFSSLLPNGTADQSSFSPIPVDAADDSGQFSGVWSYAAIVERQSVIDEGSTVSNIIQSLVGRTEYSILDKNTHTLRPLRYSDFMVLVNTKKHIIEFIREFSERNIPARAEGKITFSECPALKAVSDIMSAIASPEDQAAVYNALTSSVFNVSDAVIIKLRMNNIRIELSCNDEFKEYADERTIEAVSALKALVSKAYRLSPASVFGVMIEDLHIIEKAGADDLEYLYYALELLRSAELSGEVSTMPDAAAFILELLKEDSTERCLSLRRDENKVHVANLHKVKGLEAPVVILAHPYKRGFDPDKRSEHSADGDTTRIFALKELNTVYASTQKFQNAFEMEKASSQAESLRLLYVAVTRARNALIISEGVKPDGIASNNNPWESLLSFAEGDFFECVSPGIPEKASERVTVNASELYEKGRTSVITDGSSQIPTYRLSLPS